MEDNTVADYVITVLRHHNGLIRVMVLFNEICNSCNHSISKEVPYWMQGTSGLVSQIRHIPLHSPAPCAPWPTSRPKIRDTQRPLPPPLDCLPFPFDCDWQILCPIVLSCRLWWRHTLTHMHRNARTLSLAHLGLVAADRRVCRRWYVNAFVM